PLPGARGGCGRLGQLLGADARREDLAGDRAAHAASAQAARGGGEGQRSRYPLRGPGGAADAWDQRLAGARRGGGGTCPRGVEAGAIFVNGIALHRRPGVKEVFMSWLSAARPDLVPRYERLYEGRAYAPSAEQKRIGALVRAPNRSTDPRYQRRDQLAERRRL